MKLLILFIVLNIVNVVLQTARSIITIKGSTTAAAVASAISYGLYTVVLVYTNCELELVTKVAVVALTNFIGVYIVKFIEKKMNKDKLWKYEISLPMDKRILLSQFRNLSHNYIPVNSHIIVNVYSYSQAESREIDKIISENQLKYFVTESKVTLTK